LCVCVCVSVRAAYPTQSSLPCSREPAIEPYPGPLNSVYIFAFSFSEIHFNIMFPSTP